MEEYDLSIDNYIKGDLSICREERQYALYLSNILRYYGNPDKRKLLDTKDSEVLKKIFKNCGFDVNDKFNKLNIEKVFYEVTFMRDFLERNRRINCPGDPGDVERRCLNQDFTPSDYHTKYKKSFNMALMEYVKAYIKEKYKTEIRYDHTEIEEKNYGQNDVAELSSESSDTYTEVAKTMVRAMMNAKPDIAVIYSYGEREENVESRLLFLECKFESGEDNYTTKNRDKEIKKEFTQRKIQWHIANFLREKDFLKYGEDGCKKLMLSDVMNPEEGSKLVKFGRRDNKIRDNILISDLISLDKRIFGV